MQSGVSDDEMEDESLYEGDSTSASAMLPICGSQAPLPFGFWLCFSHNTYTDARIHPQNKNNEFSDGHLISCHRGWEIPMQSRRNLRFAIATRTNSNWIVHLSY